MSDARSLLDSPTLAPHNPSADKTKAVAQFLVEHPKVKFHFTPTYSSWLNQVELWFAKIERDLLARGIFTSVADFRAQDPQIHPRISYRWDSHCD